MANFTIGRRARQADSDSSSDSARATWKTSRAGGKRSLTFSAQLTMGFALTAVMTVIVLMVVLSVVWEGQFQKYTRSNMQRLADATAEALAARYDEQGGWTDEVLEYASSATSISSDAGIQVLNSRGAVIYDDTWAKSHTK